MTQAGIYIHIPFCRARCSYCDFATCGYDADAAELYVGAVCREIETFNVSPDKSEVDTIYFGGGTPSLLAPCQISFLLEAVRRRFRVTKAAEVTMEIDPGTASLDALREFQHLGINRASFGAQTFDDAELRRLNRRHTVAETRHTFDDLCEAGFANISLDLIAGLPAQTISVFANNVEEALRLRPTHISFYILEVHEGTPLANLISRGRAPSPDDDRAAEMYRLLCERTAAAGYTHYEISNFSLPSFESRHNTKYWMRAPVFGFGCSAHSFDGNRTRWRNERDVQNYILRINAQGGARVKTTTLDLEEERAENLFLSLRLLERGVDLDEFRRRFHRDVRREQAAEIERLNDAGLIQFESNTMRLTSTGALLSNEVFTALM